MILYYDYITCTAKCLILMYANNAHEHIVLVVSENWFEAVYFVLAYAQQWHTTMAELICITGTWFFYDRRNLE